MKKHFRIIAVLIMVTSIFMLSVPKAVQAIPIPVSEGIASGDWQWTDPAVPGKEVNVDLTATSASEWLQLLTRGLKIDAPARICHPFQGGQFNWTGEIRQLVDGKWVKLETENKWVPDEEGTFMSCAAAPAAGTYALFGYYTTPAGGEVSTCAYDTDLWTAGIGDYDNDLIRDLAFYAHLPNLPAGTVVKYTVVNVVPTGAISGAMHGIATMYPADHIWAGFADFLDYNIQINGPYDSIILRINAAGCTVDLPITGSEPN